jgi:serine protease Do
MIGIQGDEKDGQAIISKVNPGGPAERAGLKVGDIVLSFDGESIKSFNQLKEAVHGCLPGDQISIEIAREGRVLSRTMVVGLRNP